MDFSPPDLSEIFAPGTPPLARRIVGLFVFGILVLVRCIARRSWHDGFDPSDLLVEEAPDHALGTYNSVADGIIIVLRLKLPHQVLSYRVPFIGG